LSHATLCLVSCPSPEKAAEIGRTLVEERLAAAANVLPGMRSIYRWEGAIRTTDETLLLLKSLPALFEALSRRVVELHPYAVPCVVALPIEDGNREYLQWLERETLPQYST
jgi:periplasmic divalent cation tolerance protein